MKTNPNKIKNKTSLILAVIGTLLIGAGAYGAWAFTSPTAAPTNDGNMKSLSQLAAMINPAASCINNSYTTPASFAQGSDNYPSLYGLYTALPAGGCNTGAVSNPCVNMGNGAISGFTNPAAAPANTNYSFKSLYNKIGGDPTTSEPINPSSGIGTNDFYTLNALETRINSIVSARGYDTCNEYCGDSTVNGGETCDGQANCTSCACDSGYTWSGSECQGGGECIWAKSANNANASTYEVAVGPDGVYIAGHVYNSVDFGGSCPVISSNGGWDIFVAKFDQDSGTCEWAKNIGGTGDDSASSIAVGPDGVYVTGIFRGANVNFGCNTYTADGLWDGFIAKFNSNNGLCLASHRLYGAYFESPGSIDVDANGVYVSGVFQGTTQFGSGKSLTSDAVGSYDMFVAKYDLPLSTCHWAKQIGGDYQQGDSDSISVNGDNVWVLGSYGANSATFTDNCNTKTKLPGSSATLFTARYDSSSGNCMWNDNILGVNGPVVGPKISATSDSAYITGDFRGTTAFNGCSNFTSTVNNDLFIAKYISSGTTGSCSWAKHIPGNFSEGGGSISATSDGIYMSSVYYDQITLPSPCESFDEESPTKWNSLIAKFDSSGNCQWSKKLAGSDHFDGRYMAVDSSGIFLSSISSGTYSPGPPCSDINPSSFVLKLSK